MGSVEENDSPDLFLSQMDMGESVAEAGEKMIKSIQGKVSAALDDILRR